MKKWIFLILIGIMSSCLTDRALKLTFETYAPEQLNDGWEIATPESVGFDRDLITGIYERLFSEDLYPTARSLLIVRNGKLVAEAYCRDKADRFQYHALQSATKSLTSIAMGIAVTQGLIDSLDMPVYHFIPEYFDDNPLKRNITLYHALTMQTGLAFVNDDHTNPFFNYNGSSLKYVLSKPMRFDPGASFYYNDGDPQLISGVIQAVTGMKLARYADQHLFQPLGIRNYYWEEHADGLNFGAVGLWLTPRDMAKIGRLMLQNGSWNGKQILSPEWVEESTRIHANTNYGYFWWNFQGGRAYMALGHGEQVVYVNHEANAIVVLTTDSYSDETLSPGIRELIYDAMRAIID